AESLSCGTPVLAFGKGGALEIVAAGETGEFFDGSPEDFIKKLEKIKNKSYDKKILRQSGLRFSREVFRKKFIGFLKERRLYEKENT
ncbi:MAG TPA: glycosyltransferase, partial [Spirochaetota bacterium]|nr:glycosyltransferase [Spirochaetota bacterium]